MFNVILGGYVNAKKEQIVSRQLRKQQGEIERGDTERHTEAEFGR